jgi:hypothetical protein
MAGLAILKHRYDLSDEAMCALWIENPYYHAGAVLIHHGKALDAPVFGTGLIDKHDTAVEITLPAGEALIDLIRDDVSDPAEIVLRVGIFLAGELSGAENVPKPELGRDTAIRLARGAPGYQGLGLDVAPSPIVRSTSG